MKHILNRHRGRLTIESEPGERREFHSGTSRRPPISTGLSDIWVKYHALIVSFNCRLSVIEGWSGPNMDTAPDGNEESDDACPAVGTIDRRVL